MKRKCSGFTERGACKAHPMKESDYCFFHDPAEKERADAARRARKTRERKEASVLAAYLIDGLENPEGLRRALQVALTDVLTLPNTLERARVVATIVQVANNVNKCDLADQVATLQAVIERRGGSARGQLRSVK